MSQPITAQRPQVAPRPAVPERPTQPPAVGRPSPLVPVAPDRPSRWHTLLPRGVRNLLAEWGWWQNPTPMKPSDHLDQVLNVLHRYGWCRSLDFSPTGRMCIRGAQTFLEHAGHVTPDARQRAVDYMQQTLQEHGYHQPFFAWNDFQAREFRHVQNLIIHAAAAARSNGE